MARRTSAEPAAPAPAEPPPSSPPPPAETAAEVIVVSVRPGGAFSAGFRAIGCPGMPFFFLVAPGQDVEISREAADYLDREHGDDLHIRYRS